MIITHDIPWAACLSHQLFPAIKKGWKDTKMKPVHFFWGLGSNNLQEIAQVKEKGEEWWYGRCRLYYRSNNKIPNTINRQIRYDLF